MTVRGGACPSFAPVPRLTRFWMSFSGLKQSILSVSAFIREQRQDIVCVLWQLS